MDILNNIKLLSKLEARLNHHSLIWVSSDGYLRLSIDKPESDNTAMQIRARCKAAEFELTLLKWADSGLSLVEFRSSEISSLMDEHRAKIIAEELNSKLNKVI